MEAMFMGHEGNSIPPIEHKLELLRDEFSHQAEVNRQQGAPIREVFFTVARERFDEDWAQDTYREAVSRANEEKIKHVAQRALRAVQRQLLPVRSLVSYPQSFTDPAFFRETFDLIASEDERRADFRTDVVERNIMTDLRQRYWPSEAVIKLLSSRLGPSPRVLDIGSSVNHGLIGMTALMHPYHPLKVYDSQSNRWHDRLQEPKASRKLELLLGNTVPLGPSLGIDKENIHDPAVRQWAYASRFYPEELFDPALVEEYELFETVEEAETPFVSFSQHDFLEGATPADSIEHSPVRGETFEVVQLLTMLNQLTPKQRAFMIEVAKSLVDPNVGVVIIQDFVTYDPAAKQFVFAENWSEGTYRTYLWDVQNPGDWQEIFVHRNARCEEVRFGLGRVAVKGVPRTMRQLLSSTSSRKHDRSPGMGRHSLKWTAQISEIG